MTVLLDVHLPLPGLGASYRAVGAPFVVAIDAFAATVRDVRRQYPHACLTIGMSAGRVEDIRRANEILNAEVQS